MYRVGLDVSALDVSFKEHATRGIGRYVGELQSFFASRVDPALKVVPFDHSSFLPSKFLNRLIDAVPLGRRTIKQQLIYPWRLGGGQTHFDLIHFPAHMDAPAWCSRRLVVTVLDLIPLICADLYQAEQPGFRFRLARWLECRAIQQAAGILAISEHTARDVQRVLGVPPERIRVTPLGVDASFFEDPVVEQEKVLRQRYGFAPERPLVLYVGGIDPRKNWRGLLDTLKLLLEAAGAQGSVAPQLVMVGKIDQDRQYPKLCQRISELGLDDDVIMTGYLSDMELRQLFRITQVFLFLSLYEGFGLPPLEALAAGVPVVSSNTSCLPEVLDTAAVLVDPVDPNSAAEAVWRILTDSNQAAALREQGPRQARRYSWEATGQATLSAYKELLEKTDG